MNERRKPSSVERNLLPSRVLDLALLQALDEVEAELPTGYVVIVRVHSLVDPLAAQLTQIYGAGLHGQDAPQVLDFHTQLARPQDRPARAPLEGAVTTEELAAARRFVGVGPCFAAPLAKRGLGAMTEQLTVGRALNKDLVLRSQGVSKLHAWFEIDQGQLRVVDAGSKNGTFVGGQRLAAREPAVTPPGETLTFGAIDTLPCSAASFWHLVRG